MRNLKKFASTKMYNCQYHVQLKHIDCLWFQVKERYCIRLNVQVVLTPHTCSEKKRQKNARFMDNAKSKGH